MDKYLSTAAGQSRSNVKKLIRTGAVTVNSAVIKDEGFHVNDEIDVICLNGSPMKYEKYIYLAMNKPTGVISATEDDRHDTVIDLLTPQLRTQGLFPVGRLDKDTTGLLILTNDGQLSHFLTAPSKKIPKTYLVQTASPIAENAAEIFKSGIYLKPEDIITAPAELKLLSPVSCRLTIFEGKFHQIKRMFRHIDNEVTALHRLSIADYALPDELTLGGYIRLGEKELSMLGYKPSLKH